MLVESVAILVVCMLLVFVFLRSRHVGYAVAALPVLFIPVLYVMASAAFYFAKETVLGARVNVALAFVCVIALALACAAVMLISRRIASAKNRRLYLAIMLGYNILLGWVYIYSAIEPLM